jgi:hypothetical protein
MKNNAIQMSQPKSLKTILKKLHKLEAATGA